MRLSILLLTFLFAAYAAPAQKHEYNIQDYIDHSGKTVKITMQLQDLIDHCSDKGGGTIIFPAGDYLTGTIVLKDNTFLRLDPGAILYGSKDIDDYKDGGDGSALIYANGAKNIGILGKGIINGQGDFFWKGKSRPYIRPDRFVLFEYCEDVYLQEIKLLNSPNWNVDLRYCDRVWIEGISIISPLDAPNTDGIDPVSSQNVFISNCYIETGDDAICPKANPGTPTENLVVTNCVLISDDSAIKLGTGSDDDIRNCVFSNIIIRNSQYGIAFYAKDGGTFQNIRFDNIHVESTVRERPDASRPSGSFPIFIDLEKRSPESTLGWVRDIYFSDITIDSPDGHCIFLGQPDHKLSNIHLSDISYTLHHRRTFEGKKKPRGTRKLTDKAPNDYTEVPAHFAFAHVDGLYIDNLQIKDLSGNVQYERRMIWGYDIHNVVIEDFHNSLTVVNRELPQMHFKESSAIEIKSSTPAFTETPFLYLEGASTRKVVLQNNSFLNTGKIAAFGEGFNETELIRHNNLVR